MFKFLKFGRNAKPEVVIETQRQTFERLVTELNEAIAALPDMPAVTISPATGEVSFALPDHFPDEALALPAPEEEVEAKTEGDAETDAVKEAVKDAVEEIKDVAEIKADAKEEIKKAAE